MAECYNCKKEIGIFTFWKQRRMSAGKYTVKRYTHEMAGVPFIHCPECDTKIQPTAITMYGYFAIVFGGTCSVALLLKGASWIVLTGSPVFFFIMGSLWWKYAGIFKEPVRFPGEK
ncbi:MAG: hypothetical protein P9M07_02635 [Candidatus Aceula meridiana]|nr:hypothetical protein [Candidatus Aceula meridiana]